MKGVGWDLEKRVPQFSIGHSLGCCIKWNHSFVETIYGPTTVFGSDTENALHAGRAVEYCNLKMNS